MFFLAEWLSDKIEAFTNKKHQRNIVLVWDGSAEFPLSMRWDDIQTDLFGFETGRGSVSVRIHKDKIAPMRKFQDITSDVIGYEIPTPLGNCKAVPLAEPSFPARKILISDANGKTKVFDMPMGYIEISFSSIDVENNDVYVKTSEEDVLDD